jgi:uncharacterized protein
MNISNYPLFVPLDIEHKSVFDSAFINMRPEISEFTFTNLYSWRRPYNFEVSMLDDFIILRASIGNKPKFFMPLGTKSAKEVMVKLLEGTKGVFIRLPEDVKSLFNDDDRFIIEQDRDNNDYLFKASDLITLAGRKYDGKRNLIKKFRGENKYTFIEFNASNISRCLDFEEKWCSIKDCDGVEGLNNERRAIKDMVENFFGFGLIAGGIEINSAIVGLAIAEKLNPNTLVIHILKADPNIQGLYQAMMNEFLEKNINGFEYVNLEQDLGIEGLRRSKESYHPVKMIDKYKISLR